MKPRIFCLFLICLFSGRLAVANDIYIAQNSQGSDSGLDAADAHSLLWLNTQVNWGAGTNTVNPGDIVHLVGTFTSTLVVQGSGAPGNPVKILFEPGANFTTGCWPSTGAIQLNGASWIVIDGGSNGIIQNTSNGTGLATQNNSRGIGGGGNGSAVLYNSIIRNLTVTNIYTKVKGKYDATRAGYCIDVSGSSITISNCVVSDGDGGLSYSATDTTQSNIFLLNNKTLNCNHTIVIGIGDHNCYLTNLVIAGNFLDHWDVWDCPGNTPIHLDGIIIFNNAYDQSSILDGTRIYGNTFGGYVGTRTTAAIFTDLGCSIRNYYIYNNLFLCFAPGSWGNGFITAGVGSNIWVVNNTCVGTNIMGTNYGGGIGATGTNVYVYNNCLLYGSVGLGAGTADGYVNPSGAATNDLRILNAYFSGVWSDYNVIATPAFAAQLILQSITNGNFLWQSGIMGPRLLDWQTWYENEWGNGSLGNTPLVPGLYTWAQTHCDPHSTSQTPRFNLGTYIPASSDTVAVGRGTNLSWLGITNDILGNPRSTNGNWTIGAYEVPVPQGPLPLISLTISDNKPTNGENVTLTWTTTNATAVTLTGYGTVPLSGSINFAASNNSTNFVATASGAYGTNIASASITIRPSPPSGLRVIQR